MIYLQNTDNVVSKLKLSFTENTHIPFVVSIQSLTACDIMPAVEICQSKFRSAGK